MEEIPDFAAMVTGDEENSNENLARLAKLQERTGKKITICRDGRFQILHQGMLSERVVIMDKKKGGTSSCP